MKCTDDLLSTKNEDPQNNLSSENDVFFNVNLSVHKLFHPRHSAPCYFNDEGKCRVVKRRRCTISCAEDENRTILPSMVTRNDAILNRTFQRDHNSYQVGLSQNGSLKSNSDVFNFNLNTSITKKKKQNIYNWEIYRWSPIKDKNKIVLPLFNRNALRKSVEETISKSIAVRSSIRSNLQQKLRGSTNSNNNDDTNSSNYKNKDNIINNTMSNSDDNNDNIDTGYVVNRNRNPTYMNNHNSRHNINNNSNINNNNLKKRKNNNNNNINNLNNNNNFNNNNERKELNTVSFINKNTYYLNRISEGSSCLDTLNEARTDVKERKLENRKALQETYMLSNTTQSDYDIRNKNDFRESLKTHRDTDNIFVNSESTISSFLLEREKHDLTKLGDSKNVPNNMERTNRSGLNTQNLLNGDKKYKADLLRQTLLSSDIMNFSNQERRLLNETEEQKKLMRRQTILDSQINELQVDKRHSIHVPNYVSSNGFTDLQYHPVKRIRDNSSNNNNNNNSNKEYKLEEGSETEENCAGKRKLRRYSDVIDYQYFLKCSKGTDNSKSVNSSSDTKSTKNTQSNSNINSNANSHLCDKLTDIDESRAEQVEPTRFVNIEPSALEELSFDEANMIRKMKMPYKKRKRGECHNNFAYGDSVGGIYDEFETMGHGKQMKFEPFSDKNGEEYIFSKSHFGDIISCLHNKTLIEVICKLKENARCVISKSLFKKLEENTKDRENKYPADFFFLYRHLGEVVDDAEYKKHLKKERSEGCYLDVPFPNLREIMNLDSIVTFDETDDSDEYHEVEVKMLENYYCKINGEKTKHMNIFEENKITTSNIVVQDKMKLEKLQMESESEYHDPLQEQLLAESDSSRYALELVHNKMQRKKDKEELQQREEQLIQYMQKIKADKDEFYNSISNERNDKRVQHTKLTTNENFILSGHLFNIHFSPKYGPVVYLLKCEDDKYYYRTIEISRNLENRVRELLEGKREYYRKGKKDISCQNKNNLCVLFTESDIKNVLYVPMSCGWSHYGYFKDQCNVLFFRRPKKG